MINKRIIEVDPGDGLTAGDPATITTSSRMEVAKSATESVSLTLAEVLKAAAMVATAGEVLDIGYYLNLPTSYNGTPESFVSGKYGRLCWDYTNKVQYVKDSNSGNTGWRELIA